MVEKTLQYVERFRKYKNLCASPPSPPPVAARPCAARAQLRRAVDADRNAVTTIRSSLETKGMVRRPPRRPLRAGGARSRAGFACPQAQYEVASLANLCLSDVNEAKKLVPTLGDGRFEGEEEASLKQILDQIQNAQTME